MNFHPNVGGGDVKQEAYVKAMNIIKQIWD